MDSVEALKSHHFHGQCRCFYFDYKLKDDGQRYGDKHPKNNTLFDLSEFDLKQYEPWEYCSSAQMLIEIE